MKTLKKPNTAQPLTIRKLVKDLLSPAEHFARLVANANNMEDTAWREIRRGYEPYPVDVGCGFADPSEVRRMVGGICKDYGMEAATETLLAYLYFKHRQLFLTASYDFYGFEGGYYFAPPLDEAPYEVVTAYGYSGSSGHEGDIVDFGTLDKDLIPFNVFVPKEVYWRQVSQDYELPLGMFSYCKALEPVESALRSIFREHAGRISYLHVLENLAHWAQKLEDEPQDRSHYIALVTHARLLQELKANKDCR